MFYSHMVSIYRFNKVDKLEGLINCSYRQLKE